MSIAFQPNIVMSVKALGQAYASIKVKTPDAYHEDRFKL
jgi:hypothetical protein